MSPFLTEPLLTYAVIGFAAQMVDSALGMAFGTLSSSLLLAGGFPARLLSATVHLAEILAGGFSTLAHWRFKNIDYALFKALALPAVLGACFGSAVLIALPGNNLKPIISVYFIVAGALIVVKTVRPLLLARLPRMGTRPAGFFGGFFDAFFGAGWGEFAASALILGGQEPRKTVGSLNAVEFLVSLTVTLIFVFNLRLLDWRAALALAAGGMAGAPIGAWICKTAPTKGLTIAVGACIALLGIKNLLF